MTTNKTIHSFLNDAEEQLKTVLKEQENYDDMIELILLPSIREQVEAILVYQTGAELTEELTSFLGKKKVLNKLCKDLENVHWKLLGEGMEEKVDELRRELREKLEIKYIERIEIEYTEGIKVEYTERIKRLIKNNQTLEGWMKTGTQERGKLKLELSGREYGLVAISSKLGIKGDPVGYSDVYYEMLHVVYGEEAMDSYKKEFISHIKNYQSFMDWMMMTKKDKNNLKLKLNDFEYGLVAIARRLGIEGNPITNTQVYYRMLRLLYGEEAMKSYEQGFIGHIKEAQVLEDWMKMSNIEKEKIKLKLKGTEYGLYTLSTKLGIEGNPINDSKTYYAFMVRVFGKEQVNTIIPTLPTRQKNIYQKYL